MIKNKEILKELTDVLKKIFNNDLMKIILYGSYARTSETEDSDIDFLVLTNLNDEEIREKEKELTNISVELSLKYDLVISVVVINLDLYKKYLKVLPFYQNIEAEGIEVYGK